MIPFYPLSLDRINRLSDFAIVRRPQPTYEVKEDKDKVELILNIPGAKAEDINSDLEHNGRAIRLSGISKVDEDDVSIESRFEKVFMLGRQGGKFDEDNITAWMSGGTLTITALKFVEEVKEIRSIFISGEFPAASPDAEDQGESEEAEAMNFVDMEQKAQEDVTQEKEGSVTSADVGEEDLDEDAVIEL